MASAPRDRRRFSRGVPSANCPGSPGWVAVGFPFPLTPFIPVARTVFGREQIPRGACPEERQRRGARDDGQLS
jgi:hypothetical protein